MSGYIYILNFCQVGVIPARYASVRFPGKPLADIMGKPMVVRTWEQACKASTLDLVNSCIFVCCKVCQCLMHVPCLWDCVGRPCRGSYVGWSVSSDSPAMPVMEL